MNTHLFEQLRDFGVNPTSNVRRNLVTARLYEEIIRRDEALCASDGPIIARTGRHTGRSARDKFTVRDDSTDTIVWWGDVNQAFDATRFQRIQNKVTRFLNDHDLYVLDGYAGADERYRLPVRVVTCTAWHSLFARNLLIPERDPAGLRSFEPGFTILHAADLEADPEDDGTRSGTFVLVNFAERLALIGGTAYAGEIKKTVFTVMNKLLPEQDVLSMHCSANYGRTRDDVALFFGLSGTGKTTLSTDSSRTLIGDDEHGWGDDGVFNIEGGCYAKVIRLSAEGEPEIHEAAHKFGTVLENVIYDPETRRVDFDDASITENTRAGYPITHISTMDPEGAAGHPRNVFFLTADAFGVLPPIAKLDTPQAMYHYLSGYTAKVAGTEMGVTEPTATFSACFGAPFLPLPPGRYARLFGELLDRHQPNTWLVNTGWTGGPYGEGERISLRYTRQIIRAAMNGELDGVETVRDPIFGLHVPTEVPEVPSELLMPRNTWADKEAYDRKARKLAAMFAENFKAHADQVSEEVRNAGPQVEANL